jgi:ribonuclease III
VGILVVAVRDPLEPAADERPLSGSALTTPIEALLGHDFARPELLREAMTHRSALQGKRRRRDLCSNERMEFIGDRVLGLLIAEWLVERFPKEHEGDLGHRLGALVSQTVLAAVAEEIGLGEALAVAANEARDGVRKRASVQADALEAVLGALYLDGGIDAARNFIRHAWSNVMEEQREPPKDSKSTLQEWMHARGIGAPQYIVISHAGPPHAPEFVVTVAAAGCSGTGTAGSKRAAEQLAARDLLRVLGV